MEYEELEEFPESSVDPEFYTSQFADQENTSNQNVTNQQQKNKIGGLINILLIFNVKKNYSYLT